MKYPAIVLSILVIFLQLSAVDEKKPLNLGEYIIERTVAALTDTLGGKLELAQYNKIENIERFRFRRILAAASGIIQPHLLRDYNVLIGLEGGDHDQLRASLQTHDEYLGTFNFSSHVMNQKKKEGWLERAGEFHWLPVWKIVSMQNGVTYRDYRSDFGETEIRSGKAALKISDLCADHELRIGLYGEIIYSELEQDSSKHEDWNITSSLSLCYKKIDFQPSYWYTQEEHVTAVTLSATDILIFNRIGLWAGVTKKYAVLSLPFTIRLALMQGLNLVLCNEPALEVSSYLNEIDANHYARTEGHLLHPLKPVDVKAALEINTAIPFTVYYRVQAVLDRRTYYYQEHDFYRIVPAHVVIQSPGIELSWHQGSFHIKNSFNLHDYRIYEKKGTYSFSQLDMEMPYESGLENITRLELDVGPARIESALIYLSSRKDETGSDLDEVFRIDLTISLQILENVKFTAGIDNILAREMTYFPGYPEDVRMLRGGFQIRF